MVGELLPSFEILNLHIVTCICIVPISSDDLVLCLDIVLQAILVCKPVKVCVNLRAARIHSRPIKFWLKTPCIIMRWNITRTPGA